MSLFDCPECWQIPCICGYEYRDWPKEKRIDTATNVLGIKKEELEKLDIPDVHPKNKGELK